MFFTTELTENTEKGESKTGRKRACHREAAVQAEAIPVCVKAANVRFFRDEGDRGDKKNFGIKVFLRELGSKKVASIVTVCFPQN